jgi:mannosyltransferase OCH1-like enzyme
MASPVVLVISEFITIKYTAITANLNFLKLMRNGNVATSLKKFNVLIYFALLYLLICFLYIVNESQCLWNRNLWIKNAVTYENLNRNFSQHTKGKIPKVIHQTWKSEDIPSEWLGTFRSCRERYRSYEFMFWTDVAARDFIADKYSYFLETYDSYRYPVQRADAFRYFAIYHYGGIYLDMDVGCRWNANMNPLRQYEALIPKTSPFGFSNDVLMAKPNHAFFKQLIDSLSTFNHSFLLPYLTVFFSTGPMFLNIQYYLYTRQAPPVSSSQLVDPVLVLDPLLYSEGEQTLFKHVPGDSWVAWDGQVIVLLYGHAAVSGALLIAVVLMLCRRCKCLMAIATGCSPSHRGVCSCLYTTYSCMCQRGTWTRRDRCGDRCGEVGGEV